MAHEAAKLDHTIPLARAEPNRVGPGWAISVPRAEAADTLLHIHPDESQTGKLWDIAPKVGEPPLPPKPRPPEPPTNEELRAQLIAALERKAEAEAQLHGATEAHNRAVQLRDERRRRLLTFDQLDAEIADHTVTALRSSAGRPRDTDVPDALRERIIERDMAKVDVEAAEAAVGVLLGEQGEAASYAAHMAKLTTSAALAVTHRVALRIVERHREALAEVQDTFLRLAQYDRMVAPIGVLPTAVTLALRDQPRDHRYLVGSAGLDVSEWREMLNALMSDPAAIIV